MMIMRNTVNDDVDDVKMIIKMMKDKENDNTHESYQLWKTLIYLRYFDKGPWAEILNKE